MRAKSDENWRVGNQCLAAGDLNAAASRLYYAVFEAVLYYAKVKKGYVRRPGVSVHSLMGQYVRSVGKGRVLYSRVFAMMMGLRETADYEPETPEEVQSLLHHLDEIRQYFLGLAEN